MKSKFFYLILIFNSCSVFHVKENKFEKLILSTKILKLAIQLEKDIPFQNEIPNYKFTDSQKKLYSKLFTQATNDELFELTKLNHSVLKIFVYEILIQRKKIKNPFQTILENIHDKNLIANCSQKSCECETLNLPFYLFYTLENVLKKEEKELIQKKLSENNT